MAKISGANLIGANQVYDTSKSVNYYLQTAQKQAAQRQAEQKLLQDDLNKVKIDGIRDADRPEYIQKYSELKNMYSDISREADSIKKANKKSDFDKRFLELQDMVNDSKNLGKGEQAFNTILIDPIKRDNFKDDAVTSFQKSKTLSRNDPNFIRDLTKFERKLDLSKIDSVLNSEDDFLKGKAKWSNPVEIPYSQGNRKGVLVSQSRIVDPAVQAERYSAQYAINPELRLFLNQQYPGLPKEQQIIELVKSRQIREDKSPIFKANDTSAEDAYRNDALMRKRHADGIGRVSTDLVDESLAPSKKVFYTTPIMLSEKDIEAGKVQRKKEKIFEAENFVPINTESFGLTQLDKVYNITSGKNEKYDGSPSVEITGMGYVPVSGGGKQLNVFFTDGKGNPYSMSERHVPIKTRNDKNYQKALKAVKSTSTQQSSPKSISRSELSTKASASGYSTAEYEKLLKAKGITIK